MQTEKNKLIKELKVIQIENELENISKLHWKLLNICVDNSGMDLETFLAYKKRVLEVFFILR